MVGDSSGFLAGQAECGQRTCTRVLPAPSTRKGASKVCSFSQRQVMGREMGVGMVVELLLGKFLKNLFEAFLADLFNDIIQITGGGLDIGGADFFKYLISLDEIGDCFFRLVLL